MISPEDIADAAVDAAPAPQAPRARFSNAHDCERALVLDRAAPLARQSSNIRHILAACVGTAVGEVLERGVYLLGGSSQVPAELGIMHGSADIVFEAEDDCVIDLKVAGEKAWARLRPGVGPNEKHIQQVNAYAVALGRARWALYYLRGRSVFGDARKPDADSRLEWRVYHGTASEPEAAELVRKWERVEAHAKAGTLPVVRYQPDEFPCGWTDGRHFCGHWQRCHGGDQ